MLQLDFFDDEWTVLKREVMSCKEMSNSVRKSVHAKIGKLQGDYNVLEKRLSILEHFICCGKVGSLGTPRGQNETKNEYL